MLVAGGVIGSGIFRKPGVMAAQLGSSWVLLAVWFGAGIVTLCGALTVAELASAIPETGGTYVHFKRIYGPFAGFLYGWAAFVVIQTGSITAVCYVFAEYATQFFPTPAFLAFDDSFRIHLPWIGDIVPLHEMGIKLLAAGVILGLTFVNYLGIRCGSLVQNGVTLVKVAAMAALVAVVFLPPTGGAIDNLTTTSRFIQPQGWLWWAAVAGALQGAFWAYDGWNKVTYIAGEVKESQRTVPLGLTWGMLLVTALYVLVNVAYAYILPIDEMAQSRLVAADVAEHCLPRGGRWIAAAVMISTFGAANAIILTSARVYFRMAQDGLVPSSLGWVHPRYRSPGLSLVVQGVWAVVLLFSGTFDTLTDTLIFVSWIFYAAAAFGVIRLRQREPELTRLYRVPGYPWVPLGFVGFAILYLVLTVHNDLLNYRAAASAGRPALSNSAFGIALVLAGSPVYWWYARKQKMSS